MKTELKRVGDRTLARCKCCGCWVDVTSLVEYCNMDLWLGCDECESGLNAGAYGPRDELHRAALDHRGRP